jgi:hypothetical protein
MIPLPFSSGARWLHGSFVRIESRHADNLSMALIAFRTAIHRTTRTPPRAARYNERAWCRASQVFTCSAPGIAFAALIACSSSEQRGQKGNSASASADRQLSRAAADSLISAYLQLSTERDRYDVDSLERMRKNNGPCLEEQFGDGVASYWLARGRLIGYEGQEADTLKARLELLTVAEQVPTGIEVHQSTVTARIRTDTVVMRLVPNDNRTRWQVCGYLSTGFDFGGYGRPENVRFRPASVSRGHLLRQVDSIQRSSR